MSTTEQPEDAAGTDQKEQPSLFELPGDWFLRHIVELVNQGVDIGLTLSVGGSVVSGIAISATKYFDLFADQLVRGADEGDLRHSLADSWRQWKQLYEKPEGAGDDWKPLPVGYIHLKNASYFTPGQVPMPRNGALWRGRLDSIDGFSLGNFEAE